MKPNQLTSANGSPVPHDDLSQTVGPRGPVAADNFHLFEKLAHLTASASPSASCTRVAPVPMGASS